MNKLDEIHYQYNIEALAAVCKQEPAVVEAFIDGLMSSGMSRTEAISVAWNFAPKPNIEKVTDALLEALPDRRSRRQKLTDWLHDLIADVRFYSRQFIRRFEQT